MLVNPLPSRHVTFGGSSEAIREPNDSVLLAVRYGSRKIRAQSCYSAASCYLLIEINKSPSPICHCVIGLPAGRHSSRVPERMIGFIARCWHWASSLDWWERGVVVRSSEPFCLSSFLRPFPMEQLPALSPTTGACSRRSICGSGRPLGTLWGCLVDPDSRLRI